MFSVTLGAPVFYQVDEKTALPAIVTEILVSKDFSVSLVAFSSDMKQLGPGWAHGKKLVPHSLYGEPNTWRYDVDKIIAPFKETL